MTGDERWFVYVHVDREAYQKLLALRLTNNDAFRKNASLCEGTVMAAYNLDTGEHRTLFRINYPIHHIHPYGDRGLAFSHIPGDLYGMGYARVDRTGYSIPRPQDASGGKIIHHVPTAAGIAYELNFRDDGSWAGIMEPESGRICEFPVLPSTNHTGVDPLGRLFFYQVGKETIQVMKTFDSAGNHEWISLFDDWPTFGKGQKTHFHPRLLPGRRWLQMVGGDPQTQTNHIFLVDMSDFDMTSGLHI
jgi:hypothetical protein